MAGVRVMVVEVVEEEKEGGVWVEIRRSRR